MIGSEAFAHVMGRPVVDVPDAIDRYFERVSRDLREDRLDTLAHGGGAEIDRKCPVIVDLEPRRLLRAGGAAFDKTRNAEAVIAAVDQSAAELRLLVPPDLAEALLEGSSVFAAVVAVLGVSRLHMRNRIRLLGLRDEIAPAEFQAINAEISRSHVDQPLQEEIRLEAAWPTIGADRCLVGHPKLGVDHDMRHAVGPGQELADI